jgi:hypothetical protein
MQLDAFHSFKDVGRAKPKLKTDGFNTAGLIIIGSIILILLNLIVLGKFFLGLGVPYIFYQ